MYVNWSDFEFLNKMLTGSLKKFLMIHNYRFEARESFFNEKYHGRGTG